MKKIIKWSFVVFAIFLFLGVLFGDNKSNKPKEIETIITPTASPQKQLTQTKVPTITPEPSKPTVTPTSSPALSESVVSKIEKVVLSQFKGFEVTVWDKDARYGSKATPPYDVVLNTPLDKVTVSNCDEAKRLSYYTVETLYKDQEIGPKLGRVLVTFPYYLRVSLGSDDGIPMVTSGNFSGPTNFWTVMEKYGLGEKEIGNLSNRTWGVYLEKCK